MDSTSQPTIHPHMLGSAQWPDRMPERTAALYLGCSVQLLRKLRGELRGPVFIKLEGRVLYDRGDLDDYLDACRVQPAQGVF